MVVFATQNLKDGSYDKIKQIVLKEIKPNEKDIAFRDKVCSELISVLEDSIQNLNLKDIEIFIGGSFGKGTFLKNSSDIDLFVRFPKNYSEEQIKESFSEIIKNTNLSFIKQKGSRDYYSITYEGIDFEIVPTLKINKVSEMRNTTDVSPLHVNFVKKYIKKDSNLADEIRLAKQFFKAKGLYGAESYINGFSGHILDILMIKYGTLESLLSDAKNWKDKKIIDINRFYKNEKEILNKIDESKHSSLIIVDPIDPKRNAAKALSTENYYKFLLIAHNFKELKLEDFVITKVTCSDKIKEILKFAKRNRFNLLYFKFKLDLSSKNSIQTKDIIGSKLMRLYKILERRFNEKDFKSILSYFYPDFSNNEVVFIYLLERFTLPKIKKIMGPSILMKKHLDSFIKKHKFYLVEDDRIYTFIERDIKKISDFSFVPLKINEAEKLLRKDLFFVRKISTKLCEFN